MGYDRDLRRYGRDQSYGYRPQGQGRDYERGYDRGEDLSYNRDRGYGGGDSSSGRTDYGRRPAEHGRPPQGYDSDERGFLDRAGDEVRSWFGDEEAERRRRYDERYSERDERDRDRERDSYRRETSGRPLGSSADPTGGLDMPPAGYGWSFRDRDAASQQARNSRGHDHDPSYRQWRDRQIEALDRDYDDYRRENQSKFDNDFGGWRNKRQGLRESLKQVQEHQEVVGSDGAHVGTVDHVRGERILLARKDANAGGHHHSIPLSWVEKVGDKVEINRTATEALRAWKDEDEGKDDDRSSGGHNLNRSFSGTY